MAEKKETDDRTPAQVVADKQREEAAKAANADGKSTTGSAGKSSK